MVRTIPAPGDGFLPRLSISIARPWRVGLESPIPTFLRCFQISAASQSLTWVLCPELEGISDAHRDENGFAQIDVCLFAPKLLRKAPDILILRAGERAPRFVEGVGTIPRSIPAKQ